ncbi:MAG: AAC(3) family N-acetyltransferase [Acidobacteria bacterium]|nr:AAC(3) family N-acetyltransferase [Acidobacteriota bacterium]
MHLFRALRREKGRIQNYYRRRGTRIDRRAIDEALCSFGDCEARVLLMHSSLSACGQIVGGANKVLDAVRAWSRPATLVMPTHTYCYPHGDDRVPCYNPKTSPSVVGAITDLFWRQPGVFRSLHPTHSLACEGPLAGDLCVGHDLTETPCGRGTPYEKLIQYDAAVLMFGVTLNCYTLFHTAEDAAAVPYLYESRKYQLAIQTPDGAWRPFPMFRQDMSVSRRFGEMDCWLEQRGLLQRRRLGLGELLFIPRSAAAHRTLVEELRGDPWLLVANSAPAVP